MTRADDIDAAVDAGIIDADQAKGLKTFLADRAWVGTDSTKPEAEITETAPDAEEIRFARGLHDIFLTIGVFLLLSGITMSIGLVQPFLAPIASAVAAWLLAEHFTARQKLVLPSIALAISFVFSTAQTAGLTFAAGSGASTGWADVAVPAAAAALLASIAFFVRFRLPFATGLIAASATFLAVAVTAEGLDTDIESLLTLVLLAGGLAALVAALIFDLSDPERRTLRSDNAFWLHLVAGPLIVHSVIQLITGSDAFDIDIATAISIIAVVSILALAALIIDRRAMLVAGLIYLGVAIGRLITSADFEAGTVLAITMLLLGTSVVLLGVGWQRVRRTIIQAVIPDGLARRLPPTAQQASS